MKTPRRFRQGLIPFPVGRGGRRKGAGRKPAGPSRRVSHDVREPLAGRFPVHVTVRLREGLPSLRQGGVCRVLRGCFWAACERFGFRLVEYSMQSNHLHLLVEADDKKSLSRGMQGLLIRVAKGLNRLWQRAGSIFADRYHAHILRTPREVRHALVYVLNNARKHGVRLLDAIDAFSSGAWFSGWKDACAPLASGSLTERFTAKARTWLLSRGWEVHGRIGTDEVPGLASA
jgi:REP element-mobilizing transposase RayT